MEIEMNILRGSNASWVYRFFQIDVLDVDNVHQLSRCKQSYRQTDRVVRWKPFCVNPLGVLELANSHLQGQASRKILLQKQQAQFKLPTKDLILWLPQQLLMDLKQKQILIPELRLKLAEQKFWKGILSAVIQCFAEEGLQYCFDICLHGYTRKLCCRQPDLMIYSHTKFLLNARIFDCCH